MRASVMRGFSALRGFGRRRKRYIFNAGEKLSSRVVSAELKFVLSGEYQLGTKSASRQVGAAIMALRHAESDLREDFSKLAVVHWASGFQPASLF